MLISGFYSEKTLNHHQMRSYSNPVAYREIYGMFPNHSPLILQCSIIRWAALASGGLFSRIIYVLFW